MCLWWLCGDACAPPQVFYATKRGESKKMYVTKTKWEELRQAQGLLVKKIPGYSPTG